MYIESTQQKQWIHSTHANVYWAHLTDAVDRLSRCGCVLGALNIFSNLVHALNICEVCTGCTHQMQWMHSADASRFICHFRFGGSCATCPSGRSLILRTFYGLFVVNTWLLRVGSSSSGDGMFGTSVRPSVRDSRSPVYFRYGLGLGLRTQLLGLRTRTRTGYSFCDSLWGSLSGSFRVGLILNPSLWGGVVIEGCQNNAISTHLEELHRTSI